MSSENGDELIVSYDICCIYNITQDQYLGMGEWIDDYFDTVVVFEGNDTYTTKQSLYETLSLYIGMAGDINKSDVLAQVRIVNNLPDFSETIILDGLEY